MGAMSTTVVLSKNFEEQNRVKNKIVEKTIVKKIIVEKSIVQKKMRPNGMKPAPTNVYYCVYAPKW